ncbi:MULTISPECIES: hypothetical protein [Streptomyces]|uniref:Aromatic ring-opening dioxygenase LigA n=1 Tax=Streptomyces ramulosus TaxID=47762 RepID=A0ABW1FV95_9ACTN
MESSELAAMAVAVLTGAASAVGQSAGAAVADSVRARLASTERGRTALDGLHRAPEDPDARDSARSAIQEEIEADPGLRRQLQAHLTAPGSHTTGSLLITGSQVSRSSIALGPLTINNTRGGRAVIALVAASLVALVALAVYGGVRLIVVDASPGSSQDGGARPGVRALNVSELRRVVPDLTSMPSGWERSGTLRTGTNEGNGCSGVEAKFDTAYGRTSAGTVVHARFTVGSCPRAELTAKGFEETRSKVAGTNEAREIPLPELGDQRIALTHHDAGLDETTAIALLRVGTVLIKLEYTPVVDDPEWSTEFERLASTVAARAQQAQNA